MWYLCGLGSNIAPEDNLPRAVAALARCFGQVTLSPVMRTSPQGMVSRNSFLNALVVFRSDWPRERLKQELNTLEEALGRDRSDPLSSIRDREIDVDILAVACRPEFSGEGITESYYRGLLAGEPIEGVPLLLAGQRLGQAAATIYRDQGPGHEIIVRQGQQLLHDAVKTAFPG